MSASILQERQFTPAASSVSSISLAFSSNLTAGSALHVIGTQGHASSVTYSWSDNNSGSYTNRGSTQWIAADTQGMSHATSANHAAGATTVTLTPSVSSQWMGMIIREIGGVSASPVDGTNINTGASGTTGSVSATNSNQPALWSGVGYSPNNGTVTATTGTSDSMFWGRTSHLRVTTAASQAASYSYTTTDGNMCAIAIFDEGSAAAVTHLLSALGVGG